MNGAGNANRAIVISCEYPPFPGGTGTYAGNIVAQLRHAGVQTLAIVPAYPDLATDPAPSTERVLRHHRITLSAATRIFKILQRSPKGAILLAADLRSILLVALICGALRRPYRVMVHGSEASKFDRRFVLKRLVGAAYRRAEVIFCNSRATLDIFQRSFGRVPNGKVNYLGVDESWFLKVDPAFRHPELARLPAEAAIIASVGRIEDRKGQLETIEALKIARDRFGLRNFVYVIAGRAEPGQHMSDVKDAASAAGIAILMTGRLSDEDLRRLYSRALVHILCAQPKSTKIEGFGLVLLEAAAQHCPSITTRVGGIPEVVGEDYPLLFDPIDFAGMGRAIAGLANDPQLRMQTGDALYQRAQSFTWRACAETTFPELLTPTKRVP